MSWRKVWCGGSGECEAIDEEESEDDNDTGQDAPPQLLVHGGLDVLFALHEILHCKVQ